MRLLHVYVCACAWTSRPHTRVCPFFCAGVDDELRQALLLSLQEDAAAPAAGRQAGRGDGCEVIHTLFISVCVCADVPMEQAKQEEQPAAPAAAAAAGARTHMCGTLSPLSLTALCLCMCVIGSAGASATAADGGGGEGQTAAAAGAASAGAAGGDAMFQDPAFVERVRYTQKQTRMSFRRSSMNARVCVRARVCEVRCWAACRASMSTTPASGRPCSRCASVHPCFHRRVRGVCVVWLCVQLHGGQGEGPSGAEGGDKKDGDKKDDSDKKQ